MINIFDLIIYHIILFFVDLGMEDESWSDDEFYIDVYAATLGISNTDLLSCDRRPDRHDEINVIENIREDNTDIPSDTSIDIETQSAQDIIESNDHENNQTVQENTEITTDIGMNSEYRNK